MRFVPFFGECPDCGSDDGFHYWYCPLAEGREGDADWEWTWS